MSSQPLTSVWLGLLALVAVEVGVIALLLAAGQRWSASAAWRRTFCQGAVVGVLLVTLCEFSGTGRGLVNWAGGAVGKSTDGQGGPPGKGQSRENGLLSPSLSAKRGEGGAPAAGSVSTPTLELKESFRSEVQVRLAQRQTGQNDLLSPSLSSRGGEGGRVAIIPTSGNSFAAPEPTRVSESMAVLWIVIVWSFGAVVTGARAFFARCLLMLFRFRGSRVTDEPVLARVGSLAQKLKVSYRVRVVESARLTSPIAFGILRPTIGLPLNFGARFEASRQEAMLAHELAHLAAHDPFWSLLADAATALLWWHPAAWWLRRQLQLASELAADEASVLIANGPELLAECLVEMGALLTRPVMLGEFNVAAFRSSLGHRVQRLLHLQGGNWSPPRRLPTILVRSVGAAALALVIVLCTAWVLPRALMKGEDMKSMQLNWKRSLAAFALLASVNTPELATSLEAPRRTGTLALKIIQPKHVTASEIAAQVRAELADKRSRVEVDDRTGQLVVSATEKEMKEIERVVERLDRSQAQNAAKGSSAQRLQAEFNKLNELKSKYTALHPSVQAEQQRITALELQLSAAAETPESAPQQAPPNIAAPFPTTPPSARSASEQDAFRRRYGLVPGGTVAAAPAPKHGDIPTRPGAHQRGGELEARLKEIVLDEISFDGLPLAEVLKILRDESRKKGPAKPNGINFLINPNTPSMIGPAIDPTTGLPAAVAAPEPVDLSAIAIKFNLPLREVTMKDALDAVVKVAERPIEYSLEDYGVVFSLKPEAVSSTPPVMHFPLSVRTFKVDTNTFVAGLESAFGIKVESSKDVPAGTRSRKIQGALKDLLSQLGIGMEPNKAVFYNELTGVVMVKASEEELQIVRAAIETLGGGDAGPGGAISGLPGVR